MHSLNLTEQAPLVNVVIETPRGSFLKRGTAGKLDFISPLPCPFNYGSIPAYIGSDGDFLDAVVLGPRLPLGASVSVYAWGSIGMIDGGVYEDKLICAPTLLSEKQQQLILWFFIIYAKAKYLLNLIKGRKGHNNCEGWHDAASALARAIPCSSEDKNAG